MRQPDLLRFEIEQEREKEISLKPAWEIPNTIIRNRKDLKMHADLRLLIFLFLNQNKFHANFFTFFKTEKYTKIVISECENMQILHRKATFCNELRRNKVVSQEMKSVQIINESYSFWFTVNKLLHISFWITFFSMSKLLFLSPKKNKLKRVSKSVFKNGKTPKKQKIDAKVNELKETTSKKITKIENKNIIIGETYEKNDVWQKKCR